MKDFAGKVAVISGAGSGIGAAIATACAEQGMDVVVADIDEGRAGIIAEQLTRYGGRALAVQVDVADAAAMNRLADQVYATFGACHLLCNNAGVSPLGRAWEHSAEEWRWVVDINILGCVNGVNSFVPRMIAGTGERHIVNTASAAALRLVPASAMYNCTKFAVLGFTECLRYELVEYGIGVSALCPGAVNTNIFEGEANHPGQHRAAEVTAANIELLLKGVDPAHCTLIDADTVAQLVLEGIRNNDAYVITHPGSAESVAERCDAVLQAYESSSIRHPELP